MTYVTASTYVVPGHSCIEYCRYSKRKAIGLAGGDRDVTLVDLSAGRSVRVRRYSGSPDAPESMLQEVFVPVPGSGRWLLLAFAAPFGPLVQALTKLFDAICATLRWD